MLIFLPHQIVKSVNVHDLSFLIDAFFLSLLTIIEPEFLPSFVDEFVQRYRFKEFFFMNVELASQIRDLQFDAIEVAVK